MPADSPRRLPVHRLPALLVAAVVPLALAAVPAGAVPAGAAAPGGPAAVTGPATPSGRATGPAAPVTGPAATAAERTAAGIPGTGRVPAPALTGSPAASLGAGTPAAPADDRAAASSASTTVTILGHGFGHGEGMGQYGAFGYATESGLKWTWQTIVDHYYGGTTLEPISAAADRASIAVNLSELDGASSTTVRPVRSGAVIEVDGTRRSGTVTVAHGRAGQTIAVTSGDIAVDLPGVGWRDYQGDLRIRAGSDTDGTAGQTWNVVPVEDYVAGVVPAESIASWGQVPGGENALEAQAVAARSYALAYVADAGRTCDTQACQEYLGDPADQDLGQDEVYATRAATSTAGKVMCTQAVDPCPAADIADTEYSSSTGGYSAGDIFPAVIDKGDAVSSNTNHYWTAEVAVSAIEAAYPGVGALSSKGGLLVAESNRRFAPGSNEWRGRVLEVRITGAKGSIEVAGAAFADAVGLRSDWFHFATQP